MFYNFIIGIQYLEVLKTYFHLRILCYIPCDILPILLEENIISWEMSLKVFNCK